MNTYRMYFARGQGRSSMTVQARSRSAALDKAGDRRVTRMYVRDPRDGWRIVAFLKLPPELVLL
jgi:hypothetical protein